MRVKFELDGKPIDKPAHVEYGVLDAIYPRQFRKAVCDVRFSRVRLT